MPIKYLQKSNCQTTAGISHYKEKLKKYLKKFGGKKKKH